MEKLSPGPSARSLSAGALLIAALTSCALEASAEEPARQPERSPAPAALLNPSGPVAEHEANLALGARPHPELFVLGAAPSERDALFAVMRSLGCAVRHRFERAGFSTWRCDARTSSPRARIALLHDHFALWSEAAFYERAADLDPAPDLPSEQWHHANLGQRIAQTQGVPGADIDSIAAWRVAPGDRPGALLAVIDSGVDFTHPELARLQWRHPGEVCDNGLDDDDNGFVDDCLGWDFGDDDADPSPRTLSNDESRCKRWHGTFIAGLSSALGTNQQGGSGVHWGARLINIKKHDDQGCVSTTAQSLEAVQYAVDLGATILQMPFVTEARSSLFERALRQAAAADVVLVMSAGNDGADLDERPLYPASYDLNNQLVVASSDPRDALSSWANYGALSVDLAAPGESLYSSDQELDYRVRSGSSYAVPLVAGVASLLRATYPGLSASQVVESILEGAEPRATLSCSSSTRCVASGARLNAKGALDVAALKLSSPSFAIEALALKDEGGDGFLSAGERATLSYRLVNRGPGSTPLSLHVELLGAQGEVSVTPASIALRPVERFGTLIPSAEQRPVCVASASCGRNRAVALTLRLEDQRGNLWTSQIELNLACGLDADGDGAPAPQDCDDQRASVAPGKPELCDGLDNDCDQRLDEDLSQALKPFYLDRDLDGFGDPKAVTMACAPPPGHVASGDDCDDRDARAVPYKDELGQPACGVPVAAPLQVPGGPCGCATFHAPSRLARSPLFALLGLAMMTVWLVGIRRRGLRARPLYPLTASLRRVFFPSSPRVHFDRVRRSARRLWRRVAPGGAASWRGHERVARRRPEPGRSERSSKA